jgi:acetolactate synthase-1/2/3 large subunit
MMLKSVGIDTVFTVPAESLLPLLRALIREGIKVVNAKFEPSAGFMAVAYSRVTLKPGVVIVTSGPGALGVSLPTGLAFIEGDPIIIITTIAMSDRGTAAHQFPSDNAQLLSFKPITKASFRISETGKLGSLITKAFSLALSGKPGPVYIEIPDHLLRESLKEEARYSITISKPEASRSIVEAVADLLIEAEYPVIIAGRGVYLAGARDLLLKVADLLSAPIATTVMAKGLVPHNNPLYAGVAAGKAGNMVAYEVIRRADVVLAIGNRFSELGSGRYSIEINGKLIHVNIDSYDLGRAYKPYIGILSDARNFLEELLKELLKRKAKPRKDVVEDLRRLWQAESEELNAFYTDVRGLLKPWEVIRAVRNALKKNNTIFITDVGAHRFETFIMPIYEGERYITTTSYASMGLAIPGSIAASLAYPDRTVVALVGDGGFLMTGMEIATAVQYNAKPKIIVFNDSSYRSLSIYEKVRYNNITEALTRLPNINYALLASSFGAEGIRLAVRQELESSLENILTKDNIVVVDVIIDSTSVPIPLQRLYGLHRL